MPEDSAAESGQAINRQGRSCDLEYCQECGLSMDSANHGYFITERDVNGEGETARLFREDVEGYGNEWQGFEEEDIGPVCHSCSWILQRKRERVALTDGGQPAEDGRAIPRYFTSVVSQLARKEDVTVTVEANAGGLTLCADGVQLVEGGFPSETFTLGRDWQSHLTADGREKLQEVFADA